MKSIRKIKEDIKSLERKMEKMIGVAQKKSFFSIGKMQDSLVNHLESVRVSIEERLLKVSHSEEECKPLLEKLLDISENLKFSYLIPGAYNESFNILDTMKMVDERMA